MTLDTEPIGSQSGGDSDVVAAIDVIDGRSHLVIADIARDDVWLSVGERDAVSLEEWR